MMQFMKTKQTKTKTPFTFAGFDDWVEIFQSGEQTDSQGDTNNFTTADLDSIVTNHQPSPIVIGHPKTADPAWGWSSALKREGNSLFGKYSDVHPAFSKMVENKQFPERSIRIKQTDNGYQLMHTGFLGAIPPAVSGLSPMQFSQGDDDCLEFAGDWYVTSRLSRLFRRIKNFLIEGEGEERAEEILPEYELESLSETAVEQRLNENNESESVSGSFNKDPKGEMTVGFTQEQMDAAIAKAKADAADDAKKVEREFAAKLKVNEFEKRQGLAKQKVSTLLTEQKILPAQTQGLSEFMAALDDSDDATFEFSVGEGDKAKTEKQSPSQFFNAFLDSLTEHGLLNSQTQDDFTSSDYSVPADASVDAERLELHAKALEYMDRHDGVDYVSAVKALGG